MSSVLGSGLSRLVAETQGVAGRRRAVSGFRFDQEKVTIRDSKRRVLVDITPQEGVDRLGFRRQLEAVGFEVRAVDKVRGTLEGYLPLEKAGHVAGLPGLGTITQALRPRTAIGAATSQGVVFQRVDRVQQAGIDGRGITIGALSDSYDTATTDLYGDLLTDHAIDDVASGDLPGNGNRRFPQPVVVLQDSPSGADEGRAMLQIAHDVAPGAKLCFATANTGIVGFAANVRRLADQAGRCRANVVVDDIGYPNEPMFSDSVLSDAIDAVARRGVHYFSAAGNDGDRAAWQSRIRLQPEASAIRNTNLDFTGVDPQLYDGGLQDMDPGPGTDVAQTLALDPDTGGTVDVQWDDPFDVNGATLGAPYFSATGEITRARPVRRFTFTPTAAQIGRKVRFRTDAIPSGTTDLILSVTAPDGTSLGTVDADSSPESLATTVRQRGAYTITITGYDGDQGDFTIDVRPVLSPSRTATDFNLLFFDTAGHFLGAQADDNPVTGQPVELASFLGVARVQMVIARAGTGPSSATTLRDVLDGGMQMVEYADPTAPATFGHPTASGATGVAAYDPFRPYLPESFTSTGGRLPTYFDSSGHRYRHPRLRSVPQVASTDGANTTFFVADSVQDADDQPNFFGTSAAAPHAASIAALALERAGGPGSVAPRTLRHRLERSAFRHDLDPGHAAGTSHRLTVSATGAQGDERDLLPGSLADPRFFTIRYTGSVPLRSVTLNGEHASPTAPGGNRSDVSGGLVFDPRPLDGGSPFRDDGYPFTVGATTGGLAQDDVTASFADPSGLAGRYHQMTVAFGAGLAHGQSVSFGVDRDLLHSSMGTGVEGNGADELGGATFIPQNRVVRDGMEFTAERVDGRTIHGVIRNRIGRGFSPTDGYGVINAERAVLRR